MVMRILINMLWLWKPNHALLFGSNRLWVKEMTETHGLTLMVWEVLVATTRCQKTNQTNQGTNRHLPSKQPIIPWWSHLEPCTATALGCRVAAATKASGTDLAALPTATCMDGDGEQQKIAIWLLFQWFRLTIYGRGPLMVVDNNQTRATWRAVIWLITAFRESFVRMSWVIILLSRGSHSRVDTG